MAAPVVVGAIARDPGSEPRGLLGDLVRRPPHGSLAIRKFALEVIGVTNRAEYVRLLAEVARERGPYAGLAIRALGLMDGGVEGIDGALRDRSDLRPLASDIGDALLRSPDTDASKNLVGRLAISDQIGARDIAAWVSARRMRSLDSISRDLATVGPLGTDSSVAEGAGAPAARMVGRNPTRR